MPLDNTVAAQIKPPDANGAGNILQKIASVRRFGAQLAGKDLAFPQDPMPFFAAKQDQ